MYQLMQQLSRRDLLQQQLPVALISLVMAELFFKFHSFVLECGAFLATWYALDWIAFKLRGR